MTRKISTRITPCLWFESQAEEAATFYTSIFNNSKVSTLTRYGKERHPIDGIQEGSVMTVKFELDGQEFLALNGGPQFKFNEAISLIVNCESQEEIDYYWEKLSNGGDEDAQVCGWLKDKYGVSWQVVPIQLNEMLNDPDTEKSERVTRAMLQMKKMNIQTLRRAYEGDDTYDLVVTRVFDTAVQEIWNAWKDSELVKKWWGPTGFTCPLAEMDFREGGTSLVCMRAPIDFGGQDMYSAWTYTRIVPLQRIEYIFAFTDQDAKPIDPQQLGLPSGIPKEVRHVITFKKLDNDRTELTVAEYGYTTEQARDLSMKGLEPCLDKMSAILI